MPHMRGKPTDIRVAKVDESDESRTPSNYLKVALDAATRTTLEAWLHLHLVQIEQQMQPVLARFQQDDDQVEGNMPGADYPSEGSFRVNYPLTKRKVREVANRIKQAYFDADPMWGIDLDDPNLFQLAIQVEKALDTATDHELDEEDDLAQAIFDAVKHGVGALIPTWRYHEERVRELESWTGFDGLSLESLQDLFAFEEKYPAWREHDGLREIHALLSKGQGVEREVTAPKVLTNHPDFQHVEAARLRVYPSTDGMTGLWTTPLYGFVEKHMRFELEDFVRQGVIDQEQLTRIVTDKTGDEDTDAQAQSEEFEIFKGTMRYRMPEDGETPGRYHVWYAPANGVVLRCRFYTWWIGEPDLIPCYVRNEEPGFFKRGIAWDVLDEHTILNVLLNLYLNGIDMANAIQWKTKYRSLAHQQLLSKRWSPHSGLVWKDSPNEVDAVTKSMTHLSAIVQGFQLMKMQGDDTTGTTTLQSGRETPTDPSAPGIKTIALLQQVQPNEKDLLRSLEPSMRAIGRWTLWMYFQGMKLRWIDELPGGLRIPVEMLPELAKRLHPRATLFELDRQGRFNRDVGLLTITQKILGTSRPDVILKMLRMVISQAGGMWGRMVDTLDLERMPEVAPTQPGAAEGLPVSGNGRGTLTGNPLEAVMQRMGGQVGV